MCSLRAGPWRSRVPQPEGLPEMPRRLPRLAGLAVLLVAACSGQRGVGTAGPSTGTPSAHVPSSASSSADATTPPGTAVASPDRTPGTKREDTHGVAQVWVPGGTFRMGADKGSATPPAWAVNEFPSEQPAHEVAITRGYWLDTTEVTVAAFEAFKAAGGYDDHSIWSEKGWAWRTRQGTTALPDPCLTQKLQEPQVCVTWYEAEAYATWRGGRLPTEAEWEFAARGPASSIYPWGNAFDMRKANLEGSEGPVAVGSYPEGASWIGALDLAGNAMEWVADWYSTTYYAESPREDPSGPADGSIKAEKGGWWGPPQGTAEYLARSSYKHFEDPPFYEDHHIGFRIVSPA